MTFILFDNIFENIFFYFILSILIFMILIRVFNKFLPVWFCKILGGHIAPTKQGFDGCSKNGICPRCGKKVLQDSQGNWF